MPDDAAARRERAEATAEAAAPPVLVRAGGEFDGLLLLRSPARIDGRVSGEIETDADLWIGEGARVRARIRAGSVVVAGAVEGDVQARDRIELRASARVSAALHAPRLSLAEGCVVQGSADAAGREADSIGREAGSAGREATASGRAEGGSEPSA